MLSGTEPLQTLGDWLRFTVTCFSSFPLSFVQGLHGPQEEAMFLVGRFLGLEQDDIPLFLNARLTQPEIEELRRLIIRRVDEHIPVPYLVNEAALGGYRFRVDERVLIPRSYIAELIPGGVILVAGRNWKPKRILDIGTGSGCLAILAAHAFPEAVVDAVDTSTSALEVAELNVSTHGLAGRVHLIRSDLFASLPGERYDMILANPPYEPSAIVSDQPPEVRHEPAGALDGGRDGMNQVRRIIAEAGHHLANRGLLVVEVGELRPLVMAEFPGLRHTVMELSDRTDAVLAFKAADLRNRAIPSRRPRDRSVGSARR